MQSEAELADVFVLAAGFGTRLQPLTLDRPKPLVPMCGIPMLAYSLAAAKAAGAKSAIVNAHYLSEQLLPYNGLHEGLKVEISVEPEILGTGGGLKKVLSQLQGTILILNADVLHNIDLAKLRDAVPPSGAAMALRKNLEAETYGIVATDEADRVVDLVGLAKATPQGDVERSRHFTGVHAMSTDAIALIPDEFSCVVRTAYTELVPKRMVSASYMPATGFWLDAGNPAAYLDANMRVLRGEVRPTLDPFTRSVKCESKAVLRGKNWIGKGAFIPSSATLEDCIVGDGAVIPEGANYKRVVVWSNTSPQDNILENAIVHDSGTVKL